MNQFKKVFKSKHSSLKKKGMEVTHTCNICRQRYIQRTRFDRFCKPCRDNNELYRFAELDNYPIDNNNNVSLVD
jgi:hypothetical protein